MLNLPTIILLIAPLEGLHLRLYKAQHVFDLVLFPSGAPVSEDAIHDEVHAAFEAYYTLQ